MNFAKEDNIKEIRDIAKMLFCAVDIIPNEQFPIFCSHPFTNSVIFPKYAKDKNGIAKMVRQLDLTNEADFNEWKNYVFKEIDNEKTVLGIFYLVIKPYRLTMLKYTEECLTKKTFSELLGSVWVTTENPNGDVNVSLAVLAKWFRNADKKALMTEEDYTYWKNLPEELTVYRGVAIGRKPYGLSWTPTQEKAEWFAHRYDRNSKQGYVQKATIKKQEALAYLNTRNEEEIVVDSARVKDRIIKC